MAFVVRRVEPQDWVALRTIRLAALAESPRAFLRTHAEEVALPAEEWQARARDWLMLGAEPVEAPTAPAGFVGMAGVHVVDDARADVVSVWVAPQWRGQGVAQALMAAAEGLIAAEGHTAAHLLVVEDNTAALGLYRRLGYRPTGVFEPYPLDPALRELELAKPLP